MGNEKVVYVFEDLPNEQEKACELIRGYGVVPKVFSEANHIRCPEIWTPEEGKLVGIVTDLFFPYSKGDSANSPNGLMIYWHALANGVPAMICTDADHHDDFEWLHASGNILSHAGLYPARIEGKHWVDAVGAILNDEHPFYKRVRERLEKYGVVKKAVSRAFPEE